MDTKVFISFLIGLVLLALSFYLGWYMRGVHIDTKPNVSQGKPTVVTSVDSGNVVIKPQAYYFDGQVGNDTTGDGLSHGVNNLVTNCDKLIKFVDKFKRVGIDTTLHLKRDSIKIRTDKPYYFEKEFIEKGLELFYWISHTDSSRVDTVFIPTSLPCVTEESFWERIDFYVGFASGIVVLTGVYYLIVKGLQVIGVIK